MVPRNINSSIHYVVVCSRYHFIRPEFFSWHVPGMYTMCKVKTTAVRQHTKKGWQAGRAGNGRPETRSTWYATSSKLRKFQTAIHGTWDAFHLIYIPWYGVADTTAVSSSTYFQSSAADWLHKTKKSNWQSLQPTTLGVCQYKALLDAPDGSTPRVVHTLHTLLCTRYGEHTQLMNGCLGLTCVALAFLLL